MMETMEVYGIENGSLSLVPHDPNSRKLRSLVWNDFTREMKADGSYVATCHNCQKQLTASSRNGTTHLKNHIANCMSSKIRRRKNLATHRVDFRLGEARSNGSGSLEQSQFNQDASRRDLARMIVVEGYPFDIVNHIGFRNFVKNLQPRFEFVSSDTIKEDCMKIYKEARIKLYEKLENISCRASIVVNMWRSSEDVEYACLTCYFVDDNWSLRRKILNFSRFEAASTGEEIGKAIAEKLHDWNVDRKLSSIVLDNCSSGDVVAGEILKTLRPEGILSNVNLFHVNCCSHILNLIAQDGIEVTHEVINRVRDSVRYVKSSLDKLCKFNKAAKKVGALPNSLLLDEPNSWSSTYLMLESACGFRDAFSCLPEFDNEYTDSLSMNDWNAVKAVTECLEEFYNTIYKFSHTRVPTTNLCFNDVCGIHLVLKRWSTSGVPDIISMASRMFENFEKYWGITGKVMAVASVLDPRYKMKSVEYFCKLIYDDTHEANEKIESIQTVLISLYDEYVIQSTQTTKNQNFVRCFGTSNGSDSAKYGVDAESKIAPRITLTDTQRGLDQYLQETSSNQPLKSDLNMYLEEAVHPSKEGFDDNFNVLAWWKLNAAKYPVLSLMARDIMGIPLPIVALDNESRTLNQYLSSMDCTIVGLICAQDWLKEEFGVAGGHGDGLSIVSLDANLHGDADEYMTLTNGDKSSLS